MILVHLYNVSATSLDHMRASTHYVCSFGTCMPMCAKPHVYGAAAGRSATPLVRYRPLCRRAPAAVRPAVAPATIQPPLAGRRAALAGRTSSHRTSGRVALSRAAIRRPTKERKNKKNLQHSLTKYLHVYACRIVCTLSYYTCKVEPAMHQQYSSQLQYRLRSGRCGHMHNRSVANTIRSTSGSETERRRKHATAFEA